MSRTDAADDPAFAVERTTLAWTRSGLALAAIGALIVRAAAQSHLPVLGYPVGSALVLGAVLLWAYGSHPYRTREALRRGDTLPGPGAIRAIAAVTFAVAAFSLVFTLVIVID
jgi:uncharacterized membrane protein YidH (DUF202 family)